MKIAACMSGLSRTADYCKAYIDGFLEGHQVDWYVHSWTEQSDFYKNYAPKAVSNAALPDSSENFERKAIERFQEYCYIRLIPMYWGIAQSISLVPDHEYDLIIRLRPDIVPHQKLDEILPYIEMDSINFTYHMRVNLATWKPPIPPHNLPIESPAGFNDLLFFGPPEMMKKFVCSYDYIDDFIQNRNSTHFTASQLLVDFTRSYALKCHRSPLSLYLMDQQQIQQPIENYQERSRAATRYASDLKYIQDKYPDLTHLAMKKPVYTPAESWFEKCWSNDPQSPSKILGYNT
jgi:hypothetical protein